MRIAGVALTVILVSSCTAIVPTDDLTKGSPVSSKSDSGTDRTKSPKGDAGGGESSDADDGTGGALGDGAGGALSDGMGGDAGGGASGGSGVGVSGASGGGAGGASGGGAGGDVGASAGSDAGGTIHAGEQCRTAGAIECKSTASPARRRCDPQNMVWVDAQSCATGEACDRQSGECKVLVSECIGQEPGTLYCNGRIRVACGPDLVTADSTECATVQLCQQGTSNECAVCLTNEYECVGDNLRVCNDNHDGFNDVTTCTIEPCNAQLGRCTTLICNPGEYTCDNSSNTLQLCNSDGTAFELETPCGAGICDAAGKQCDVCIPGAPTGCANSTTQQVCDSDGQGRRDVLCNTNYPGRPLCVGTGKCVQCDAPAHCSPHNDCYTPTCENWTCGEAFRGQDAICSGGYCDSGGICRACTRASQCAATNGCYTATCDANTCGENRKETGTSCSFSGGSYCTEAGECKACTQNSHCTAPNDCYTASCSSNACSNTPKGIGSPCQGGFCNGAGNCFECNQPSDCGAAPTCYYKTCQATKCGQEASSAGTSCGSGGVCNGAGTCGVCVPGTYQCSGDINGVQLCNAAGQWSASVACAITSPVCLNGHCPETLGNSTPLPDSYLLYYQYIYAKKVVPPVNAKLFRFGFIAPTASGKVRLGIYAGNGPLPGSNLAYSDEVAVGNTAVEVTAPGITLSANTDYWIAIETNSNLSILGQKSGAADSYIFITYIGYPTMPATFPSGATTVQGQALNLYLVVRDL